MGQQKLVVDIHFIPARIILSLDKTVLIQSGVQTAFIDNVDDIQAIWDAQGVTIKKGQLEVSYKSMEPFNPCDLFKEYMRKTSNF